MRAQHRPLGRVLAESSRRRDLADQLATASDPGAQGAGPGERVATGPLLVERVEDGVHDAALDERVGGRVERLGGELVGDEPAVGADVEALQGGAAVGVDVAEGRDHRRVRERAGRPGGGLGATGARQAGLDPVGDSSSTPATSSSRSGSALGPRRRSPAPARSPTARRRRGGRPRRGRGRRTLAFGSARAVCLTSSRKGEGASAAPFSSLSR